MSKEKEEINKLVKNNSLEMQTKLSKDGITPKDLSLDEDYSEIHGRCCENILGFKKIPLGVSKEKLQINDEEFWIPICTTEGALVASMCRGIKLINKSGGVKGFVENLGITRSFTISFTSFEKAVEFYKWIKVNANILKEVGNSTSRYLKIKEILSKHLISNEVFVKVSAYTGDAMGMNMITKACDAISKYICTNFNAKIICISSNTCTDKKWSVENFANGRGRKVSLNLIVTPENCRNILKVEIDDLLKVYHSKIVLGSSLVLGGFNCQAANVVAGIFLALGQDLGHVIDSSNCIIGMKKENENLVVSLFMQSIIVGTLGGGTHLEPGKSFITQFYKKDKEYFLTDKALDRSVAPNYLALVVAGAVLAGELSGLAALTDNTLINAHLKLNRKKE
ncbi:3-hydroxy-3-methylglutaryl reductase [Tubulinosema ratisbonensis]|uniref:hydroxymethylglutaryl-CoA reductase (NADPH) n=1 Tax=Tubulinosema ratisbonensis TaxID=291195 RepID=A0A437APP1_9MICR|nr:3-hydroxy-3-methylglutaryl reductase [Tubulinosema ratisbonensis]